MQTITKRHTNINTLTGTTLLLADCLATQQSLHNKYAEPKTEETHENTETKTVVSIDLLSSDIERANMHMHDYVHTHYMHVQT